MANAPRWKGSKGTKEDPSSPKLSNTKDGWKQTRIFNGMYETMEKALPDRLSNLAGSPDTLFVDTVLLEKLPAGRGKLTIELVSSPIGDPNTSTPELEWMEIQRPLLQHPRYQSGGAMALNDDDLDIIEEWKNAATAAERKTIYAKIVGLQMDGALDFVDKLKHGQESYTVHAPVVRLTTKSAAEPACGGCDVITMPPGEAHPPAGYAWLKSADRKVRQEGLWCRVQEWMGADDIDGDLYPEG